MTSLIAIDHVSKRFGDHPALCDVSLDVRANEIHGLIGLNGAGKTTLIKCILDLMKPDTGTIRLFGQPHHLARQRLDLQFLPEKFVPSAQLKGFEYLRLTLAFYGMDLDKAEAERLAAELALRPSALRQSVSSYSKGMGQKLGLLAILLAKRNLWILDEPMSGLDPEARVLLKRQLMTHSAQGGSIFFSSHILADLDEICHRISVIHLGNHLYTGTPAEFKSRYGKAKSTLEQSFLTCIQQWSQQQPKAT